MRNDCLLKVVCVNDEEGEFALRFYVNGELKKEREEYCFDNVLISLYDFFRECCEDVKFDTRYDRLEIDCRYSYDFCP